MSGLIVDLFAGGGGASLGIELALGRPVDIAINHDAVALAVHAPCAECGGPRKPWSTSPCCSRVCGARLRVRTHPGPSMEERFWAKVGRGDPDSCWLWLGAIDSGGYGNFWTGKRYKRAARVALQLAGRPLPDRLHACHTCDNPPCVNPAHLFAGTRSDNMRDCFEKGRSGNAVLRSETTRGAANVKAKLDEKSVRALVADWNSGAFTNAELARKYGVRTSNVTHILKGRTWRHLGLVVRANLGERVLAGAAS